MQVGQRGVVVLLGIARDQAQGKVLGGLPGELPADRLPVEVIGVIAGLRQGAVKGVILVRGTDPEAGAECPGDGPTDATHEAGQRRVRGAFQLAHVQPGITLEGRCRRLGVKRYHSPRGVLAVERALGAAQHFDPFQVKYIAAGEYRPAAKGAVLEGGHRRLEGRDIADIPHSAYAVVAVQRAEAGLDLQRGHQSGELLDVADSRLAHVLGGQGSHRQGNILQGLLTLLGGHDDLFQHCARPL